MKLLSLLQGHRVEEQIGFHHSGLSLAKEGYLQGYHSLPFLAADGQAPENPTFENILKEARKIEPDFIFFQFFHFHKLPDPTGLISKLRELPSRPTIFCSGGDSFGKWTRPVPQSLRKLSAIGDITFLTGMGYVADDLVRHGGKRIALMPNGFCQVRFPPQPKLSKNENPIWDIVCVANNYTTKNPLGYLFYHKIQRQNQIKLLSRRYGKRFALFGKGWEGIPNWLGPLPFEKQAEVYRSSRIVVGGHPGGAMDYYLSDRDLTAVCSNPTFVDRWIPRVEKILRPEEHWFLYRTRSEMCQIIDRLLATPAWGLEENKTITETYVRNNHSQYHRLKEMLRVSVEYREAFQKNLYYEPKLSFFLPEVDWQIEKKFALRGWNTRPDQI